LWDRTYETRNKKNEKLCCSAKETVGYNLWNKKTKLYNADYQLKNPRRGAKVFSTLALRRRHNQEKNSPNIKLSTR
jgi:hypothetical protein